MTDIELNEAIAKKLGWKQDTGQKGLWFRPDSGLDRGMPETLPDFCGSIEKAFGIIFVLKENHCFKISSETSAWHVYINNWRKEPLGCGYGSDVSLPKAIGLAFIGLQ